MIAALSASAATENSSEFQHASRTVQTTQIDVIDEGSWNGTLKIAAKVRGLDGAYSGYLKIVDMSTGAEIAASTGITAAGIYSIDTSGRAFRIEHTRVAGAVSVYLSMELG